MEEHWEKVLEELLYGENLNCNICKGILSEPVMLVQGHNEVCGVCYNKESKIKDLVAVESAVLGNIIKQMKTFCEYKPNGCNKRDFKENLIDHQKQCEYRHINCLVDVDCESVTLKYFGNHLVSKHADHVVYEHLTYFNFLIRLNEFPIFKFLQGKSKSCFLKITQDKNQLNSLTCSVYSGSVSNYDNMLTIEFRQFRGKKWIDRQCIILPLCKVDEEIHDESLDESIDLTKLNLSADDIFVVLIKYDKQTNSVTLEPSECPVCFNQMKDIVIGCRNGHVICEQCWTKVENCPMCRTPKESSVRYKSLQDFVDTKFRNCVNRPNGCFEILSLSSIQNHEARCSFRIVECPQPECFFEDCYLKVFAHFKAKHKFKTIRMRTFRNFDCIRSDGSFHILKNIHRIFLGDENGFLFYVKKYENIHCGVRHLLKSDNNIVFSFSMELVAQSTLENYNVIKKNAVCDEEITFEANEMDETNHTFPEIINYHLIIKKSQ